MKTASLVAVVASVLVAACAAAPPEEEDLSEYSDALTASCVDGNVGDATTCRSPSELASLARSQCAGRVLRIAPPPISREDNVKACASSTFHFVKYRCCSTCQTVTLPGTLGRPVTDVMNTATAECKARGLPYVKNFTAPSVCILDFGYVSAHPGVVTTPSAEPTAHCPDVSFQCCVAP